MKRQAVLVGAVLTVVAAGFAAGYYLGAGDPPVADTGPAFGGVEAVQGFAMQESSQKRDAGPRSASLEDLLPGLEAKVAANPKDSEQRLLLAQTYAELGKTDKAIGLLRPLHRERPEDTVVTLGLAMALMQSPRREELKEAYDVLEGAVRQTPGVATMVRLYQGEILLKLGERERARGVWREHLKRMPRDDERRRLFEERIAAAKQGY